ncbi:MAG: ArsC/Spx/MgsR family protein [Pseudomonadota bacterium]
MSYTIWHNPRCSKSRATLELLRSRGVEPTIVDYRNNAPSPETIAAAAAALGIRPAELVRRGDAAKAGLAERVDGGDDQEVCRLLSDNPALIERPVVVADDGRTVIGRPPENVLDLL